jgi:hypothetical protein
VEIVEQPLLGLRDVPLVSHRLNDVPVPGEQHPPILAHAGQEPAPLGALVGSGLGSGQTLGVLLQPLDAEHFRADRLLDARQRSHHGIGSAHIAFLSGRPERAHPAPERLRLAAVRPVSTGRVHLQGSGIIVIR